MKCRKTEKALYYVFRLKKIVQNSMGGGGGRRASQVRYMLQIGRIFVAITVTKGEHIT
jgi:hypothetical protein